MITVRKPEFPLPASIDPVFIRGEPEESYVNVAMSLLLPHLEPYLIRTMRAAKTQIKDATLASELDAFCGQEGQHYRQHARLNEALIRGGATGYAPLEEELQADYKRFQDTESLAFNLAYAEGFEALTTAMALVFIEQDHSKWNPQVLDLFTWHLVEELEHRTVAFEVYQHIVGSYPYRLRVGTFAQWHLLRFLHRTMEALLAADPRTETEFGGKEGRKHRERRLFRMLFVDIFPRLSKTFSPLYTPRKLPFPDQIQSLAHDYTHRSTLLAR